MDQRGMKDPFAEIKKSSIRGKRNSQRHKGVVVVSGADRSPQKSKKKVGVSAGIRDES